MNRMSVSSLDQTAQEFAGGDEVAQTVDEVVIIREGRLRFAGPLEDLGDLEDSFLGLTDARP
jgi:hypothetical protein